MKNRGRREAKREEERDLGGGGAEVQLSGTVFS